MSRFILTTLASLALTGTAFAQVPPTKPFPIGTQVSIARPTDADEVLLRLVGVVCSAQTKLTRNVDGTYDGTITCGSVQIKGKRLALDIGGQVAGNTAGPIVPMSDPTVASGKVTILGIGSNDLFNAQASTIVGKVCNVTKPLKLDARGYYSGELTCGTNRYYFAEVQVAAGAVTVPPGGVTAPPSNFGGPQPGERWRVTDAGDVYPSINTTDCLQWPSPELKRKGGSGYWGQYSPADGDIGVVLGSSKHCDQDVLVVFIQIGAYVVPIGVQGIERVR